MFFIASVKNKHRRKPFSLIIDRLLSQLFVLFRQQETEASMYVVDNRAYFSQRVPKRVISPLIGHYNSLISFYSHVKCIAP